MEKSSVKLAFILGISFNSNETCRLPAIDSASTLVFCVVVKLLQLIWSLGNRRWIYGFPIFKWISVTWIKDRVPG